MTKLKNSIERFNSSLDQVEERLKHNEENLYDLWGTIKLTNLQIIEFPEREEEEDAESLF